MSVDAALRVPGHSDEGYFFAGPRYLRMWWKPGTPEEKMVFGPADFKNEWKLLAKAGFEKVDAMLPSMRDGKKIYTFSGNHYMRSSFVPGAPEESLIFGPAKIVDEWKCLREAGFDKVDAVIPIPCTKPDMYEEEAYFFCGSQYLRMMYTPGTPKEEIVYGPTKFMNEWKVLREAGFEKIDAFMPNSHSNTEVDVYAFSGAKYVRFRFTPGTPHETKIFGPAEIFDHWKCLKQLH